MPTEEISSQVTRKSNQKFPLNNQAFLKPNIVELHCRDSSFLPMTILRLNFKLNQFFYSLLLFQYCILQSISFIFKSLFFNSEYCNLNTEHYILAFIIKKLIQSCQILYIHTSSFTAFKRAYNTSSF
jgi:hypothetical protein